MRSTTVFLGSGVSLQSFSENMRLIWDFSYLPGSHGLRNFEKKMIDFKLL